MRRLGSDAVFIVIVAGQDSAERLGQRLALD
jgi:hypothetical protein